MTAARNGIQSALPIKNRRGYIRNICYSLTALGNTTRGSVVLALESNLHTFTPIRSLTITVLSADIIIHSPPPHSPLLYSLCPCYIMNHCEFQCFFFCVCVHSGANEVIGGTAGLLFKNVTDSLRSLNRGGIVTQRHPSQLSFAFSSLKKRIGR